MFKHDNPFGSKIIELMDIEDGDIELFSVQDLENLQKLKIDDHTFDMIIYYDMEKLYKKLIDAFNKDNNLLIPFFNPNDRRKV